MKCVYVHNNASSHVFKLTHEFFEHKRCIGEKIIEKSPSCPDLNPIKNLWSIVKMKLYEGSKLYNSKADLWEAIKTTMSEIELVEVKRIIKIISVIEKGHYINM